jgi:FtsH-binding integral membrane protein
MTDARTHSHLTLEGEMKRSRHQIWIYILSIAFAMAPIAFALIRAFRSNYDLRMLWMAFGAFAGAAVVMSLGGARRRSTRGLLVVAVVALIVAILVAGWIAIRFGATAAAGIWAVAFVLSLCWVMSHVLDTLSRPREELPEQQPTPPG